MRLIRDYTFTEIGNDILDRHVDEDLCGEVGTLFDCSEPINHATIGERTYYKFKMINSDIEYMIEFRSYIKSFNWHDEPIIGNYPIALYEMIGE